MTKAFTMQKLLTCALCSVALLVCTTSNAALINSIIGNFDIAFDGATGEITDFNRPDGGNLDSNEARTFSSLEIEVDGSTQVMKMNPPDALLGDLKIVNLGGELTTNALVQNAGGTGNPDDFGFDYFTPSGDLLRIGIDDITYSLFSPIPSLSVFSFFAEGKVLDQNLPNGILYGQEVLLSYTATEVMTLPGASGARSLVASGVMTITGNSIPEPFTGILALMGIAAGFGYRKLH